MFDIDLLKTQKLFSFKSIAYNFHQFVSGLFLLYFFIAHIAIKYNWEIKYKYKYTLTVLYSLMQIICFSILGQKRVTRGVRHLEFWCMDAHLEAIPLESYKKFSLKTYYECDFWK